MKKIIILLLCCGVLVSVVGCGGNTALPSSESPPTTVSEKIITETPSEITPPVAAVEPTEEEKEPLPTESKPQATEPTVTAIEPTTKAQSTEEPKPTLRTKPAEPSVAEITEAKKETPTKTEESQEEIYVGIQWSEVDPADIEKLVVEKINAYRIAQGDTAATILPGLTEVARYRVTELTTNFEHRGEQHVSTELKYGQYVDLVPYGMLDESYYKGYSREAIGMGDWFGTAESMSDRIADGFYHSKKHWAYVGSSKNPYIAVGVTKANGKWYVCFCMSEENYGG
ncbi:MAG: hypothetical protein IJN07_00975 [Clostridia bacterium]|nr:hypothetical protein [Clostridia bacterium]